MQYFWKNKLHYILAVSYCVMVALGFYLLATSQSTDALTSPWQTIRHSYIYVFGLATFLLGLIIAIVDLTPRPSPLRRGGSNDDSTFHDPSPQRRGIKGEVTTWTKCIIFLLILHSFLLHSYLPLTHQLLYGADQWRHIGNEMRIVQGLPFKEAVVANNNLQSSIFNLSTIVGRVSYSGLWYVSAVLGMIVQSISNLNLTLSLVFVSKWLGPIWWSLTVPVLLYFLGRALEWDEKKSLFLSWLGFLPFPFQYGGAVTIPVSFGFPLFLLGIVLLLHRFRQTSEKGFKQILPLLAVGIILSLGYVLYAVLFWMGWGMVEMMRRSTHHVACIIYVTAFCTSVFVLPVLEFIGHYSNFQSSIFNLQSAIKTIITNFTLIDLIRVPSIDYLNGNIIFNQMPRSAFVVNIFTAWRWWIPAFMIGFWVTCVGGAVALWRRSDAGKWLVIFGSGLFVNYIVSRYFLSGEQILTRRLDATLALFFIVYFITGVSAYLPLLTGEGRGVRSYLIIFIFSLAITTSYSLGPDTQAVSVDEYHAMQYVWQNKEEFKNTAHYLTISDDNSVDEAQRREKNFCVVADTFPLLALEAVSTKEIVGGGFPINNVFGQPERTSLIENINRAMRAAIPGRAAPNDEQKNLLSSFDRCWYVGDIATSAAADYLLRPVFPKKIDGPNFGSIHITKYSKP